MPQLRQPERNAIEPHHNTEVQCGQQQYVWITQGCEHTRMFGAARFCAQVSGEWFPRVFQAGGEQIREVPAPDSSVAGTALFPNH